MPGSRPNRVRCGEMCIPCLLETMGSCPYYRNICVDAIYNGFDCALTGYVSQNTSYMGWSSVTSAKLNHKPPPRPHHGVATSKSVFPALSVQMDIGDHNIDMYTIVRWGVSPNHICHDYIQMNRQGFGTQLLSCTNRLDMCVKTCMPCQQHSPGSHVMACTEDIFSISPFRPTTMFCSRKNTDVDCL